MCLRTHCGCVLCLCMPPQAVPITGVRNDNGFFLNRHHRHHRPPSPTSPMSLHSCPPEIWGRIAEFTALLYSPLEKEYMTFAEFTQHIQIAPDNAAILTLSHINTSFRSICIPTLLKKAKISLLNENANEKGILFHVRTKLRSKPELCKHVR